MYYKNTFKYGCLVLLVIFIFNYSISETLTKYHSFNGKNLCISVDKENEGRLISVYGLNENLCKYGAIKEENIVNVFKDFFNDYSEILEVNTENLKPLSIRFRGGKYYIHYQQYYIDIPVYRSYLSFILDQNNKTTKILCNLYKNINIKPTAGITNQNAESVAIEHFLNYNQVSTLNISNPTQLLILPKEFTGCWEYTLAYKVVLEYKDEYNSIKNEYFIDANTTEIIEIKNKWTGATLSGSLRLPYYPDYNSSVSYTYCGNTNFKICNSWGQEVTSSTTNSNGTFSIYFSGPIGQYYFDASIRDTDLNQWCYTNLDNSFVQVQGTFNWYGSSMSIYPYFYESTSCMVDNDLPCNVYYHVNKMHDYFTNSPFIFSDMNYKMYANIMCYDYWNGHSDGINIKFGEQGGISWAKSASCINHEYSHCVIYHIYDYDWIGNQSNNQPSAMDEGFADYFDCAYRNDDIHCEGLGDAERNLSNTYVYNSSENFYWNSQVISGACWDVRSAVTDINVDGIVKSHKAL